MDKENEIDDAKLLSRYTLDITSLTTASMDFSLPSIGISAAPSLARTSTECSKNDEVEKNNEITTVNKQIVLAAIVNEVDRIKNGKRNEGTEEDGREEEAEIKTKGEESEGVGGEIEEIKEIPASLCTIPNQYCSLIEAQGLKQLISIPTGELTFYFPLFFFIFSLQSLMRHYCDVVLLCKIFFIILIVVLPPIAFNSIAQQDPLISSPCTSVMDMYMVGKVVGVGSYGKVRVAWHRLTCTYFMRCMYCTVICVLSVFLYFIYSKRLRQ